MGIRKRRITLLLLINGLLFAFLGQGYFVWRPEYMWDGVVFYALGGLFWALAAWQLMTAPRLTGPERLWRTALAHPVRFGLLGAGVLIVGGTATLAVRASPESNFSGYLLSWIVGLTLFLAALTPRPTRTRWRSVVQWVRHGRIEGVGLVVLLLVALLVRVVSLETIPVNFGGDEGTQALAALRLVAHPMGNPFSTGWYSVPTASFLVYGLAMRLFGSTVAGARALSSLIGTGTVLGTFLLARKIGGRWMGWVAAVLVAFGHYGIHFSRLASNQVADAFFGVWVLTLLLQGLQDEGKSRSLLWFGLTGLMIGCSWYGYFGARLTMVLVAGYLIWRALVEPRFLSRHRRGLMLLLIGALLAAGPLILHYLAYPGQFFSRYNQVSIFASGWLEREVVITGRSTIALLLQQFWKSISAFNVTPDPTFWYHPDVPLLDPVTGVFFVLGLIFVIVRIRRPSNGLLLGWFGALVLLGWTLTENPPSSQRGVGSVPVVAILAALGLVEAIALVQRLVQGSDWAPSSRMRLPYQAAVGLVLCVVTVLNLRFYFHVFTPQRVYGNPTAEIADVLCDTLEERETIPPIYFDGPPQMYWDFGAIAFRMRGVEGQNWTPSEESNTVDLTRDALFVILAVHIPDLERVQQDFPGGVVEYYYSEVDGRLLFVMYKVPAGRSL